MPGERIGWVLSAVLHVSIAVFAVVGVPYFQWERPAPPPPISVDFVKIDDLTRVVEPVVEEEQPSQARPDRPAETARAPEPEPVADAVPLPEPTPAAAAPKPKPKPTLSETQKLSRRVTPRQKPKPPSRIRSDNVQKRLAALVNRELKEEEEQSRVQEPPKAEEKAESATDRFAAIRGRVATASLQEALRQKLEGCWNIPVGAKGIEKMFVKVRIYLRPDGTLSRQPEFVSPVNMNDPFERTFAESARTAVFRCAPFVEAKDYILEGNPFIDFDFDGSGFAG